MKTQPLLQSFFDKVRVTPTCWIWLAAKDKDGYGMFHFPLTNKMVRAHRLSYEIHKGFIPSGLQLDHLCRAPACVNPWHLDPVTGWANTLRSENFMAVNARKTHCNGGHPFTEVNTYSWKKRWRSCKACHSEMMKRKREEKHDA